MHYPGSLSIHHTYISILCVSVLRQAKITSVQTTCCWKTKHALAELNSEYGRAKEKKIKKNMNAGTTSARADILNTVHAIEK